ncbi:heme biosynthesis HemY N-terminal domain-containing protein [Sessilibacter corallicola]|uniref:heme biosynthesis HemY N-terminal domain-containing protein n=1 Tax=Sessilibacter corallicola TaxID=2904075 RepID=UPI001E50E23E|nr:heme biosynthesis HemY N-terminal domain-containing protein [Sessilibacter corallicola]MCE2027763.1 hypothetical protein [Sessilibacter corallicola]
MKTKLIQLLLLILAVLVGGFFLEKLITANPGFVLISIGNTTVQTEFWFSVFLVIFSVLLLYLLIKFIRVLFRISLRLLGVKSQSARAKQTAQGITEFLIGNYATAKKLLLGSAGRSPMPEVNLLVAAQSAHFLGDENNAQEILSEAEKYSSNTVALTLARSQLLEQQSKLRESIVCVEQHLEEYGNNGLLLERLCHLYAETGDWAKVRSTLPKLKKRLTHERKDYFQRQIALYELRDIAEQSQVSDKTKVAEQLQVKWLELPSKFRHDPQLLDSYIRLLSQLNAVTQAEQSIKKILSERWDTELLNLYGTLNAENPQKQLSAAEAWIKTHDDDPALYLALGRISLRNRLWGQAREYFEKSIQLKPSHSAYAELGRLLESLGENELSRDSYRQSALILSPSLPALPLPEKSKSV